MFVSILKSIAIVSCLALTFMAFTPAARADLWNQASKLHFNTPIEVPGVVLPQGRIGSSWKIVRATAMWLRYSTHEDHKFTRL